MSIEVRPFRREDPEQLTALVNAHVGAVVPGGSVWRLRLGGDAASSRAPRSWTGTHSARFGP